MSSFKARYKGKCHVCGEDILIGQQVCFDTFSAPYSNGREPVIHLDCLFEVASDSSARLSTRKEPIRNLGVCSECFLEKSLTGACGCVV